MADSIFTNERRELDIGKTFFLTAKNYGKKVAVFGGSVSSEQYGATEASKRWRELLNMSVTHLGVPSAGFSSIKNKPSAIPIPTQVQNAINSGVSYDIYILWCSTNDFNYNREIGNWSDYTALDGYDESKLTTQCGGINKCIKLILEHNPQAEIYLFTSIRFFSNTDNEGKNVGDSGWNPFSIDTNTMGYKFSEYVAEQKKCCEYYNIPYLDQYEINGVNMFNYQSFYKTDKKHLLPSGYDNISYKQVQFLANGI